MRPLLLTLACALASGCAGPRLAEDQLPQPALDGGTYDLGEPLAQTPVALVVWQSWCEPCAALAPRIAEAYAQRGGEVAFVGVVPGPDADVDEEAVRAKRAAYGFDFPQLRDRSGRLTRALRVRETPTIVVLARDRRVLYRDSALPPDWDALLAQDREP